MFDTETEIVVVPVIRRIELNLPANAAEFGNMTRIAKAESNRTFGLFMVIWRCKWHATSGFGVKEGMSVLT